MASDEYFKETQDILDACKFLQKLKLFDHSVTDPIFALDESEYRKKKNLPHTHLLNENHENQEKF